MTGIYETPTPVLITYGPLCAQDVVRAVAGADPKIKEAIEKVNIASLKVEFIDADDTTCEFFGLDCLPLRCGDTLRLRITI